VVRSPYQLCHYKVNDLAHNNGRSVLRESIILEVFVRAYSLVTFDFPEGRKSLLPFKGFPSPPSAVFQGVINFKLSVISGALHEVKVCPLFAKRSASFSKKAVRDFSNNGVASKCAFTRYCYCCRYYYTKIHEILKSLLVFPSHE